MSKIVSAVIGSAFGDEGKGLFTDYLCAQQEPLSTTVVRFNGGAQAGHTVQTADGQRHVFSHFGAGSFTGARTFLSRFYVVNPLTFIRERLELAALGLFPRVVVDPAAAVTTPYDIMINQMVEEARGHARHGSCGLGFGETVARTEEGAFALCVADLALPQILIRKLKAIRAQWVPQRLKALGIEDISSAWTQRLADDAILHGYAEKCADFIADIEVQGIGCLTWERCVVFEGAQGLLLDQHARFFPHVTRSNTGLENIIELCREAGLENLDVIYATRSYLTRHGAGPLPFELAEAPYEKVVDPTNKPNAFQGSLRFSWLNMDLLQEAIMRDLRHASSGAVQINPVLGVSCMDQLDATCAYVKGNIVHKNNSAEAMLNQLSATCALPIGFLSHGPTREAIIRPQKKTGAVLCDQAAWASASV